MSIHVMTFFALQNETDACPIIHNTCNNRRDNDKLTYHYLPTHEPPNH